MLKYDNDVDQDIFRSSLIESILNHPCLKHLSAGEKASLITFLTENRPALPDPGPSDIKTRLRALKKAVSDAKRLANSLNLIDAKDALLGGLENAQSDNISDKIIYLNETADELKTRAKNLVEDAPTSAKSTKFLRSLYAFPLLTTLESYGITTNTCNQFPGCVGEFIPFGHRGLLPLMDADSTESRRIRGSNKFQLISYRA